MGWIIQYHPASTLHTSYQSAVSVLKSLIGQVSLEIKHMKERKRMKKNQRTKEPKNRRTKEKEEEEEEMESLIG